MKLFTWKLTKKIIMQLFILKINVISQFQHLIALSNLLNMFPTINLSTLSLIYVTTLLLVHFQKFLIIVLQ